MGAALSAMGRVAAAMRSSAFTFRDMDARCSSAQQMIQWFPPAARVPSNCKLCSCCRFATARSTIPLRVCCDASALLVDAAAHAHGVRMVVVMSTSGSSGVRIPAELILTATGRVRAAGALAALGDGFVLRLFLIRLLLRFCLARPLQVNPGESRY